MAPAFAPIHMLTTPVVEMAMVNTDIIGTHLELCEMEILRKKPDAIFTKSSIIYVWQGPIYAFLFT